MKANAQKTKKSIAKWIVLFSVCVILIPIIGISAYFMFPHTIEISSIYEVGKIPEWKYIGSTDSSAEIHTYHYTAWTSFGRTLYIDSDLDIDYMCDTGESAAINLRPVGIRLYSTDMMGVWVKYPVIVYEYTEI